MQDELSTRPPLVVTPDEAARLLGVCPRTLRNLVVRGGLTRVKVQGTNIVRYAMADLTAFIDRNKEAHGNA